MDKTPKAGRPTGFSDNLECVTDLSHPPDKVKRSRTPEPPYCWQSKGALKAIRDGFDSAGMVTSAIAVYVAMTEIASDEHSEVVAKSTGFIGFRAGVHANTVKRVLPVLRDLGVIAYENASGLRVPNAVTLLSLANGDATSHTEGATSHFQPKSGKGALVLSNLKESPVRISRKKAQEVDDAFLAQQRQNFQHLNVDSELGKARAWITVNPGRHLTPKFFVGWLNRAKGEPIAAPKEDW